MSTINTAHAVEDNRKLGIFAAEWLKLVALEKENERNIKPEDVLWGSKSALDGTIWFLGLLQVMLLILFATVGGTNVITSAVNTLDTVAAYNMFTGIEIMMFIGFGYLMTFLKWYGLGAIGFTMLITAIGLQWYVFCDSFWYQIYNIKDGEDWVEVPVNIYSLINALYGVTAVLITFGAVIGKVSPLQLVVLTFIELVCHAVNYRIFMEGIMNINDTGRTYISHMFGAYFGLAVAFVLGSPRTQPQLGNTPDIFSLIGTLFMWVYWPSFVASTLPQGSAQQQQALVNTVLALSASTICSFFLSSLLARNGRYRPVDVQFATLAGGVAIGAAADMRLSPFSAIMIGIAAGIVSCFGFNVVQPWLEQNIGLHDTCGVHNLHAMPAFVGAIASVIISGYQQSGDTDHGTNVYHRPEQQWWRQLVAIPFCMGFALATGLLTGVILRAINGGTEEERAHLREYHDQPYWEVADDYNHSLYSELARAVKASTRKEGVTLFKDNDLDNEVAEWSSHEGRRNLKSVRAEKLRVLSNVDTTTLHGGTRYVEVEKSMV